MAISLVTQFQPYTDEIFTTESKNVEQHFMND